MGGGDAAGGGGGLGDGSARRGAAPFAGWWCSHLDLLEILTIIRLLTTSFLKDLYGDAAEELILPDAPVTDTVPVPAGPALANA